MKKIIILLVSTLLLFTACAPGTPQRRPTVPQQDLETNESSITQTEPVRNCRITANAVDVKSGVGRDFRTIGTLRRNDEVGVLDQVGNWYVIQLNDNQVGCIETANAAPIVKEGAERRGQEVQQAQQPQQPQEVQQPLQAQQGQQAQQTQRTQRNQQTPNTVQQTPAQTPAQTNRLGTQEQQMVDLVNRERTKNGLSPLSVDLEVARVAGIKSQDMVDNNYFSHNSPTYGSPFDMMKKFGISYLHAGENLAGNTTVEKAHTALMNSSGHRQNILSPNFTHIGIGVRTSPKYGYVYTQMFISKPR